MNDVSLNPEIIELEAEMGLEMPQFPVIPNPEGEVTGYVTKLGFTPEILQVKDPEVHDWARAEEKPTYTKAEVGLGNVDNTSDLNKPISTATQTALDGKVDKVPGKALSTNDYTDTDKAIVDGVTSALATKVDKIAGKELSSNDYTDYEKTKLAYIQAGAEVNVQADWIEANRWSDAFILNKPTKLSDFSNDTGFITSTVDNLTYYYKKSETYTQAEVNALIGSIVTISFLVVQELPTTGETNIIYLVPAEDPNPDNIYEEYIYVNDDWEMIGTTKVDLSNYYTKTETDTLLNGKVDKDGDKVLSDNNYSDTDKTKLDGIEAEANKTVVDNSVTSTSTNPVESKAIYNLLNDLLPEATATGNPIAISNASGLNAKSLKVELEPIQDLHGYDSPWVGGGGANKFDEQWENGILNTTTGANVSGYNNVRSKNYIPCLPSTQYNFIAPSSYGLWAVFYDENKDIVTTDLPETAQTSNYARYIKGVVTTPNTAKYIRFYMVIGYGTSYGNDIAINYPSSTSSYAPYSNICPISGRTQTTVSVNSEDTTTQFGQTVYGATVKSQGGTDNKWKLLKKKLSDANKVETEGETYKRYRILIESEGIDTAKRTQTLCDKTSFVNSGGEYIHFNINSQGVYIYIYAPNDMATTEEFEFCIPLATPTTINTPAFNIPLNKGNNTIVGQGDMELIYSKEPQ